MATSPVFDSQGNRLITDLKEYGIEEQLKGRRKGKNKKNQRQSKQQQPLHQNQSSDINAPDSIPPQPPNVPNLPQSTAKGMVVYILINCSLLTQFVL